MYSNVGVEKTYLENHYIDRHIGVEVSFRILSTLKHRLKSGPKTFKFHIVYLYVKLMNFDRYGCTLNRLNLEKLTSFQMKMN